MGSETDAFLERWHRVVAAKDCEAIVSLLAPNATMGAPPYFQKLEGRDLIAQLLGIILRTIEDFTYNRQWRDGRELALEFTGRVDDLGLQGIDLITLDDQGRLANLDVLIRPLNALTALRDRVAPQMAEYLKSLQGSAAAGAAPTAPSE